MTVAGIQSGWRGGCGIGGLLEKGKEIDGSILILAGKDRTAGGFEECKVQELFMQVLMLLVLPPLLLFEACKVIVMVESSWLQLASYILKV